MGCRIVLAAILLLWPACGLGQLSPYGCDTIYDALSCISAEKPTILDVPTFQNYALKQDFLENGDLDVQRFNATALDDASTGTFATSEKHGFYWGRALTESLTLLVIEQAYVVHTDFRWVVSENGVPFNHYWRDYMQSLSGWTHSGWDDGDPNWYGYIGHPIQGALTGFIQIQNDPKSERLEFSKTKAYGKSRLKAAMWNAAYSTQWNLGPLSEVTVEKYGTKDRAPWNQNGSFPCNTKHCYTGVGQIDIVMTPLAGTGWLVGEDFLDEKVVRRVEEDTPNRLLIDTVRVALNPIRAGANMLHGNYPWYRASRDAQGLSLLPDQKTTVPKDEAPREQLPNHGNISFGYSYTGASHCEVVAFGTPAVCDSVSSVSANLSGWDTSVEKMYLRYFGAVADFSGQYGGVSQSNFLFGLRGGTAIGRFRPFGQAMIGAVHVRQNIATGSTSDSSFAEDLGLGVDYRLMRLLSWRNQIDALKTGSTAFERRNLRLSSGFAVRF